MEKVKMSLLLLVLGAISAQPETTPLFRSQIAPLEFPSSDQNYPFRENATALETLSQSAPLEFPSPDGNYKFSDNDTIREKLSSHTKKTEEETATRIQETLKSETEWIEDDDSKTEDHKFDVKDIQQQTGIGVFSGAVAGALIGVFLVICTFGYIGLLLWRRYLEARYGSRQILVNEEDFNDPENIKHFSVS